MSNLTASDHNSPTIRLALQAIRSSRPEVADSNRKVVENKEPPAESFPQDETTNLYGICTSLCAGSMTRRHYLALYEFFTDEPTGWQTMKS